MLARKLINNINNFFNIKDEYFDYKNLTLRKRIKFPCKKLPECIINLLKDLKISSEQITTFKIEESSDKFTQSPHADTPEGQTTIIVPLKFTNNVFTITYKSFYYGKNKKGYKYRPNNKKYYKRCLSYRNLSFGKKNRFKHEELSGNYRMSSLQCAYGISEMKYFNLNISLER